MARNSALRQALHRVAPRRSFRSDIFWSDLRQLRRMFPAETHVNARIIWVNPDTPKLQIVHVCQCRNKLLAPENIWSRENRPRNSRRDVFRALEEYSRLSRQCLQSESSLSTVNSPPSITKLLLKVWRMSWMWKSFIPARLQAFLNPVRTSRIRPPYELLNTRSVLA